MEAVIVGIDPGTTTAFAVLDLEFNVVCVKSKKEYSLAGLISDIYKEGNPVIVGTDKKEVPSFIKEFSQKTGAVIFAPGYDTKKGEKKHTVKNKRFLQHAKNAHEIDALASAIYAYNDYRPLLNKIKTFVEKNNKKHLRDRILIKVLNDEVSISTALSDIEKPPRKTTHVKKLPVIMQKKEVTKEEKEIRLLNTVIKKIKAEHKVLKEENNRLRNRKINIDQETKKIISFKEKRALFLEKENRKLKKEIALKEKIIRKQDRFISQSGDAVLLKKLKNLGSEEFRKKQDVLDIGKEDILLVEDIGTISDNVIGKISEMVKIIVYRKGSPKPMHGKFILIKDVSFEETKYFALAKKELLEKEIEKAQSKNRKDLMLKEILEEYRRGRIED
jgi:uncharacterized protein